MLVHRRSRNCRIAVTIDNPERLAIQPPEIIGIALQLFGNSRRAQCRIVILSDQSFSRLPGQCRRPGPCRIFTAAGQFTEALFQQQRSGLRHRPTIFLLIEYPSEQLDDIISPLR